jgi:hypothetical protein
MSASGVTQQDPSLAVSALVAALMRGAQPAEIASMVDQLEVILSQGGEVPAAAIAELRSAIELVRGGQPCPAVSALLAARSELIRTPR